MRFRYGFVGVALAALLVGVGATAQAQTVAIAGDSVQWEQPETLSEAQALVYDVEIDGAATRPAVTCSGSSVVLCKTPLPSLSSGSHSVRVRAVSVLPERTLTGDYSAALAFTFRGKPGTPRNLTIAPGEGQGLTVLPPGGEN